MPGDETPKRRDEDYESEEDDDDELEQVPNIDVDVTKLNPLSPEVISKQVFTFRIHVCHSDLTVFLCLSILRRQLIWVHIFSRARPDFQD
jgi:translation initiation factor 2 subunit 3